MTLYSDALLAVTLAGTLQARIHNLRAAMGSASARLERLIDNSNASGPKIPTVVEDEIALVQAGLEVAIQDDERAANR